MRLEGGSGLLAVSPNGEWIAADAVADGPDAVVWDASGVRNDEHLPGPGAGIIGMAANPSGSLVALSYDISAESLDEVGYDVADRGTTRSHRLRSDDRRRDDSGYRPARPHTPTNFSPDGELVAANQTEAGPG